MSIQESRRSIFERWASDHVVNEDPDDDDSGEKFRMSRFGGGYLWDTTQAAWEAWNAAADFYQMEVTE